MKKGKFIVLDGTDGSGKATQTNLLVTRLCNEGHKTIMQDFPRYGQRSAAMVEEYLNGNFGDAKEVGPYRASVFYACDRFAASKDIRSALESGIHVVSNRYVSANMGHQAGKISDLNERDKFLDWLDELEFGIFEIPRPDLQILLYADPAVAQKLVDSKGHRDYIGGKKRDIHEADLTYLIDAANAYKYCAEKFNWKTLACTENGEMKSREQIHDAVYNIVFESIY